MDMADNSYKVMISGQWYTVPRGAIVKESNRIGYAIVCTTSTTVR